MNFPHFINVLHIHLVWCFIQEGASLGDHLGHGLLQLGALLHQVDDPLVQTFVVGDRMILCKVLCLPAKLSITMTHVANMFVKVCPLISNGLHMYKSYDNHTRPVASFEGELYDCDKHPRCAVRVRS